MDNDTESGANDNNEEDWSETWGMSECPETSNVREDGENTNIKKNKDTHDSSGGDSGIVSYQYNDNVARRSGSTYALELSVKFLRINLKWLCVNEASYYGRMLMINDNMQ